MGGCCFFINQGYRASKKKTQKVGLNGCQRQAAPSQGYSAVRIARLLPSRGRLLSVDSAPQEVAEEALQGSRGRQTNRKPKGPIPFLRNTSGAKRKRKTLKGKF